MAFTIRQRILKLAYPLILWTRQIGTKEKVMCNEKTVPPPVSFYSLSATANNGETLPFETLKGKKVLLVNTASNCGYTAQYADLQKLYRHAKEDLEIIAFPANDFKEQERGSDADIRTFCAVNFGVSFPLTKKAIVVKTADQHPVYQWLTNPQLNGWNDKAPAWNFAKYLVNEEGVLTHYFDPGISPVSTDVLKAING
ncbi:MAG: glutathione peroxidase [Bacteroidota bacterium]|nr:glutathione peroxidase [Bacteroidota bacterium]